MNVKPLGDKLIVQRAEAQTQTDSGIYLPESATDKPKEGTVIAVVMEDSTMTMAREFPLQ